MEFLFELFPLILFVAFLAKTDIYVATAVLMAAVLLQLVVNKLRGKPINKMTLVAAGMVVVLGGLTLLLKNDAFIKWKPTAVYWLFAAIMLGSQFIGERNLAQRFYQTVFEQMERIEVDLTKARWARINLFWVLVFVLLGIANYVAFQNLDTVSWGYFKLVMVGAYMVVLFGQASYVITRYTKEGETLSSPEQ